MNRFSDLLVANLVISMKGGISKNWEKPFCFYYYILLAKMPVRCIGRNDNSNALANHVVTLLLCATINKGRHIFSYS
jgi:hypothetical protein